MSFFHLLVLSFVQGLTEFLPVSSSGHLALMPQFTNWEDQGLAIDVAMHIGTLAAILVYYRRDVFEIAFAVLRWNKPETKDKRNLGLFIALGTVPAILFGLLIHTLFPDGIRSMTVIAATTIFYAILMGVADRIGKSDKSISDVTWKNALMIGVAQALALIPGTSRSGATMTMARFLGFARVEAARFSFLLGIPAMVAAGLLSVKDMLEKGDPGMLQSAAIGAGLSFVFGLFAIHFMLKWLTRAGLMPFVVYRLILGAVLIFIIVTGA